MNNPYQTNNLINPYNYQHPFNTAQASQMPVSSKLPTYQNNHNFNPIMLNSNNIHCSSNNWNTLSNVYSNQMPTTDYNGLNPEAYDTSSNYSGSSLSSVRTPNSEDLQAHSALYANYNGAHLNSNCNYQYNSHIPTTDYKGFIAEAYDTSSNYSGSSLSSGRIPNSEDLQTHSAMYANYSGAHLNKNCNYQYNSYNQHVYPPVTNFDYNTYHILRHYQQQNELNLEMQRNQKVAQWNAKKFEKTRKPRIMFSPDQLDVLQREFAKCRNPPKDTIASISREIGIDEERVRNYFKNKRAQIAKAETHKFLNK